MNSKCNKLRLFFYILMTFIIIFILSYFAPYFNNNSLAFTFIAGIGMFFITTIIACLIDRQIIPWCWFRIKIYSNYDKSVQKIDECLEWLVRKNICDLVTLYIRDTIIKNDYNLIAHYGLSEPEPMYGPIVFDDFRKRLEKFNKYLLYIVFFLNSPLSFWQFTNKIICRLWGWFFTFTSSVRMINRIHCHTSNTRALI